MKLENLNKGDFVSTANIAVGEFQGIVTINLDGNEMKLLKIYEAKKGVTHQLPMDKVEDLEALPQKDHFKRCLKILQDPAASEVPKRFESNRYDYIKDLSQGSGLKSFLKALRILLKLSDLKIITMAERKLFNRMKEKFIIDVETILGEDKDTAKRYLVLAA